VASSNPVSDIEHYVLGSVSCMASAIVECRTRLSAAVEAHDDNAMQDLQIACAALSVASSCLRECLVMIQMIEAKEENNVRRD
jgi:hypothetical protein